MERTQPDVVRHFGGDYGSGVCPRLRPERQHALSAENLEN